VSLDTANFRSAVASDILAYLVEHPDAEDTLQGILEWWLLEQQIKKWTAEVQMALAELVSQNMVLERGGRDGQIRFRVNRHRLDEIHALLAREIETEVGAGDDKIQTPS
jgi:hypothetical protein